MATAPPPITKAKQSKSRNGCVTCKAKRLKCDETKPACQQCHKRSVPCGGYKRDFKWRPFEETSFTKSGTPTKAKKVTPSTMTFQSEFSASRPATPPPSAKASQEIFLILPPDPEAAAGPQGFLAPQSTSSGSSITSPPPSFPLEPVTASAVDPSRSNPFGLYSATDHVRGSSLDANSFTPEPSAGAPSFTHQASGYIGQSQVGRSFDMHAPPQDLSFQMGPPGAIFDVSALSDTSEAPPMLEDEVEAIVRKPEKLSVAPWALRLSSPSSSSSSSRSAASRTDVFSRHYVQPTVYPGSPEQLTLRFDRQTCGILSITDGPTENPWRTLVWPLAKDAPALYHAIASMTAFHTAREQPALRLEGIQHMRQSMLALGNADLDFMRTDTALATTLVLAFSESWDQHTSSGIQHLRGARTLVRQAFADPQTNRRSGASLERLRFLFHTWMYMDVIARLTSNDENDASDLDGYMAYISQKFGPSEKLDPLMGCATTLFPLIGRVATLIRRVRQCSENSPAIISAAQDLKSEIEGWEVPRRFVTPEDPTIGIEECVQTAEAYRWATLLYLHQAVPELPSLSSAHLAKKVLNYLATVPLSSRTVIIQIYPLLVAGCEADDEETRAWVKHRWSAMCQRMWIGSINKCWEVSKEVWDRRAAFRRRMSQVLETTLYAPVWADEEMLSPTGSVGKRKLEGDDADAMDGVDWTMGRKSHGGGGKRRATGGELGPPHTLQSLSYPSNASPFAGHARRKSSTSTGYQTELDHEMTVRGKLHWVAVMEDWNWDVLLG